MGHFTQIGNTLVWQENQERLWLQPWGQNGLRVRANLAGQLLDLPQALLEASEQDSSEPLIDIGDKQASLRHGSIRATISSSGRLSFRNEQTGQLLLEESIGNPFSVSGDRQFKFRNGRLFRIEIRFQAQEGERFYGLGQHQHGFLDQKGCVIELHQRNTEVAIPFLVSNRKYGFLWNNPSVGRVELGRNATRWVAEGSQQLDYYIVCAETYAEVLERYASVTGKAPAFPSWASGFWQCKLRYQSQEELLNVAREYHRRGLPLSVIVADFFHWTRMGDWKFDPACWPDPAAMTKELETLGVKLMVSHWPTVHPTSENYHAMKKRGLLINNEYGVDAQHVFVDNGIEGPAYFAYYDATNPEARRFVWDVVRRNYYANGVKLFWLDNDEPDINPWHPENLRFFLGNGVEMASLYPLLHQMAFYEGLQEAGETEILTLSRSGWAGSQRYGAAIWSGDIASTFESLQTQVRAGLNIAMSGIPWWTTDIGGFHGGDIHSDYFRELIVRWFQYGVFCPLFRLHGYRLPIQEPMPNSGADNEVWSFGETAYGIIRDLLFLRERLRPYIHEQMHITSECGLPPMRPLFVDFPHDLVCETIEDEFMFGPQILVAPVLHAGESARQVYLPAGMEWIHVWNGTRHPGGGWIDVPAPLETIPVFLRAGSRLMDVFQAG